MARRRKTRRTSTKGRRRTQRRSRYRRQRGGFGFDDIKGYLGMSATAQQPAQPASIEDQIKSQCTKSWYDVTSKKYLNTPTCNSMYSQVQRTNPTLYNDIMNNRQ